MPPATPPTIAPTLDFFCSPSGSSDVSPPIGASDDVSVEAAEAEVAVPFVTLPTLMSAGNARAIVEEYVVVG